MNNPINVTGNAAADSPPVLSETVDATAQPDAALNDGIASVNAGSASKDSGIKKTIFIIVLILIIAGGLTFFTQRYLAKMKQQLRETSKKPTAEEVNVFNPEGSRVVAPVAKVGSAGNAPPPEPPGAKEALATTSQETVRPMRGPDGKVLVNSQGKALGIDNAGQVVEVPAIQLQGGAAVATGDKVPLPGTRVATTNAASGTSQPVASGAPNAGGNAAVLPPSRYGGALFVPGAALATVGATPAATSTGNPNAANTQQAIDAMLAAQAKASAQPTSLLGAVAAPLPVNKPGSIGAALGGPSATPVTQAERIADQALMLPKGRQVDCILTTRIIDELPGFTSCVLAQNLYSDNGRVLLLERGSEVSGEYGTTGQQGLRRLFVSWNRVKTPGGITVDFNSPGADSLGGSGIPGFLDKRWGERLGAAFMLSIFRDVLSIAIQREYPPPAPSTGGTVVDTRPTNTLKTVDSAADAILSEGMKTRPTLSINEGERISIYIARDLDFSSVYRLRSQGQSGKVKVN